MIFGLPPDFVQFTAYISGALFWVIVIMWAFGKLKIEIRELQNELKSKKCKQCGRKHSENWNHVIWG